MNNANNGEGYTRPECVDETGDSAYPVIRYHYMDNLRALAMLLGVVFHASLAYSPMMQNLWMAASEDNSWIVDVFAWFSHSFRMPLFFLVSGFFALMLIEKRGIAEFITHRTKRIALPFVIFLPLCLVAVIAVISWAAGALENPSPMLDFIKSMHNSPDATPLPFSTMHLWFLYNLLLFCLVIAVFARLGFFDSFMIGYMTKPLVLVFLMPLLLTPALLSQHLPLPAPERIVPQLWSFGFFGVFFLFGGVLFRSQNTIDELQKYQWLLLLSSIVLYAVFYRYLPDEPPTREDMLAAQMQSVEFSQTQWFKAVLEAYIAWHMTLFCLVLGKSVLNSQNNVLAWFSRASYWIYIVHLPVLFYLQFLLLRIQLNMWLELFISTAGTLLIGIVSYQILVAKTPVGILLNGKSAKD